MAEHEWRTLPDGRRIPLRNPTGRSGTVAVAVGTAIALGASGGTAGTAALSGATGGSSALSAAESAVVRNIKSNLGKAKRTARKGEDRRAWRQLRLRKGRPNRKEDLECAAFSYGQVQEFFLRTPCQRLDREQYPVFDEAGGTMVVAVSTVTMRRSSDAWKFRRVMDEHGTGDIHPLVPVVPFTGHHYDSRSTGRTVIVAEAEPLEGDPADEVLDATAQAAVALTR